MAKLLKIVQWNILADRLALSYTESGVTSSFITVPFEYLHWDYRSIKIIKQLIATNSDVICLQGVSHYKELLSHLKDYDGLFLNKPLSSDGIAILYRRDTLKCLQRKELQLPLACSNNENSNQVALLVMLEVIETKRCVCIATTQLKTGEHYTQTRLYQSDYLLDGIMEFSQGKLPVIYCGDFNGPPTELFYGHLSASRLVSAIACSKGREPEYTVWKISGSGEHKYTSDYIWYSSDHLELHTVLVLVPYLSCDDHKGLPSVEWPSHHLAIEAEFKII